MSKLIKYAHKNDPNGVMFSQSADDPIPEWAVGVTPYETMESVKEELTDFQSNVKYLLDRCPHTIRNKYKHGNENLLDSLILTFTKMEQRVEDLEKMIVMEFYGEILPEFSQGLQHHEMLEVVTAERCQSLLKALVSARLNQELPAINVKVEFDFGQIGTSTHFIDPKRIEREDDGSVTIVLDGKDVYEELE